MKWFVRCLAFVLATLATAALADDVKKVHMQWLGQSCWKITTPGGKVIVVDPFLVKNPKTPAEYKDLSKLGKVDLILVTHAHFDHFADAPDLAKMNNAPLWGPAGLDDQIQALGILPPELAPRFGKGGTITPWGPSGVKITATHAEHSSELSWVNPATNKREVHASRRAGGLHHRAGERLQDLPHGRHRALRRHEVHRRVLQARHRADPDRRPLRDEPAGRRLCHARMAEAEVRGAMHYGTIPQLKGTPEEYIKAMGDSPVKVFPLAPGDKLDF